MVEPMKQYHFEREKFCDAFTHTFGENDTIDFINGVFGKKKEAQSGFDYQTLNFKCFWIDEDYHILDLETGAPVAGSLRGQLDGCDGFTVVCRPVIEVQQSHFFQSAVLQVPLDGVKLHHAVGNGCAGGEDDTTASGDLIQILTLHKEVRGLLCFRLGNTAHIPHLRCQEQILKIMALIHKDPVNTQLLKGHYIILAALVV